MPGRGRGLQGKPVAIPQISEEQKAILISGNPQTDQFKDADERDVTSHTDTTSSDPVSHNDDTSSKCDTTVETDGKDTSTTNSSLSPNATTSQVPTTKPDSSSVNESSPMKSKKSTLNVDAPVFVPRSLEPAPLQSSNGASLEDPPTEEYSKYDITTSDILDGFIHKSSGDVPLLQAAATMLIETSVYPASFDTHLSILVHLITSTPPSNDVLEDLAEMLVSWGIEDNTLRYVAIKMNDYLCKMSIKEVFRPKLFTKLQQRYNNVKNLSKENANDERISELLNVTVFLAEMFHRVRINDKAVWVLGSAVMQCVFILLDLHTNETIVRACNILKLVGYVLEKKTPSTKEFNPFDKLDIAISNLRFMTVDETLSSHASDVIMSLLLLHGSKWGVGTPPAAKSNLSVDAPVQKVEEWEEYVDGSGNLIEGPVDYDDVYIDDQSDPNIDDELMREYEDFVKDLEDHLMMQEFGQS